MSTTGVAGIAPRRGLAGASPARIGRGARRAIAGLAATIAMFSCVSSDLSPPRREVLRRSTVDQARAFVGVAPFVALGGRDGIGTVVAVIDTGFDLRHPTLAGRPRWVLDHGAAPRGAHTTLEARFHGAVWSGDEVRSAVDRERAGGPREPGLVTDPVGHGTFVASVAAGREADTRIDSEGIAPGADLVLARVGSPSGIDDDALIDALDFAIDRAGDWPLVVVLSAGSIDGSHDGAARVERAIDERFHSASRRVLVVAAGNEGGAPSRIRATVARGRSESALPFTLRLAPGESVSFSVVHEGALDLALAREGPSQSRTRWVALGEHPGARLSGFRVGIDRTAPPPPADTLARSLRQGVAARVATLTIERDSNSEHQAEPTTSWALLLRGDAVLDAFAPASILRFRDGTDEATLLVPATAARATVVTALATRDRWPAAQGTITQPVARGFDGLARFSSRGPDRVHRARPDLAAPGAWVLGALSSQCDPRAIGSLCVSSERVTVDRARVASAGTSVAAPVAAGAIARLWSTEPSLSPDALVARLTVRSPAWSPRLGWGPVDLASALAPRDLRATRCTLVSTAPVVAPGEPVTFALRALGPITAVDATPPFAAETSPSAVISRDVLQGGRALIHTRAPTERSAAALTVTVTLEGTDARCEATVRVQRQEPLAPYVGCSTVGPVERGLGALGWALAMVLLSALRGRSCAARR